MKYDAQELYNSLHFSFNYWISLCNKNDDLYCKTFSEAFNHALKILEIAHQNLSKDDAE